MKRGVRRLLPFVISITLVIILVSYAPWGEVASVLSDFDVGTILVLFGLSALYYAIKIVRFWYLLQAMNIHKPFWPVALSYISAQPVSLLPAGEIYRSHALKQHTGVPLEKSLPQFTMQGALEGVSMATLMVISSLALGTLRLPAMIVAAFMLVTLIAISRGGIAKATRAFNRFPFIDLTEKRIELFNRRHKAVLTWHWLPLLYGISLLGELVGTAIAYVSVAGLGGPHIDVYQAALMYVIPVIVGFISLLPGGIGLSEQSAIGVLLLSNIKLADAVAATLVMRVTIVGLGVLFGGIALLIGRIRLSRQKSRPFWVKLLSK